MPCYFRQSGFSGDSHHETVQHGGGSPTRSAQFVDKFTEQKSERSNTQNSDRSNAKSNQPNIKIPEQMKEEKKLTKKQTSKLKRKNLTIVFNKSNYTLSMDMEDLLNRGLNFAILPLKLDLTQVLVDFKYFERTMIWKEFWAGRDQEEGVHPKIFKVRKRDLPRNYKSPNQLKTFLGAVKSELTDSENRNPAKCNLPPNQIQALKEIIQLQKDRKIIIKKCDKGAGIIVLNFEDYMSAANKHLLSQHELENGDKINFYSKVNTNHVEKVKDNITKILQEAFDNNIINKEEFDAMDPSAKSVGKFYMNFKVHKPHDIIPPERPIVSGCDSITSNIGKYVDFHLNDISTTHPSYIQDTPHFIRIIEDINKKGKLPDNALIATWDVTSLFTIIPQKEGLEDTENVLNKRINPAHTFQLHS